MTIRISDRTLRYNAKDCYITYECADKFMSELNKPASLNQPTFKPTYNHTIELLAPLIYMMARGIKVDHDRLRDTRIRIESRIQELQSDINKLCGRDINPQSSKQLKEYFYVEKGIHPYTKLNAKKESVITVDDKALQRLARGTSARAGLREAKLIQEYRKLCKLKGTYLEIKFDDDSRMRCSYNPRGTRFARVSSSKTILGTGMNMQNLHPGFLEFLVADDNCLLVQFDKRQAELIVVAYASGEENMISAVERGVDVHIHTANKMFGVPPEIIAEEAKLLKQESDPIIIDQARKNLQFFREYTTSGIWLPRTMSLRQCGKKSNHGLNYDETYKMFSFVNEITEKEAKVICDFYHKTYPGLRRWYDYIKQKLSNNGRVLTNLFERPYRFLGHWDSDLWKSAYSFIPQSSVGELVNRAIVTLYNTRDPILKEVEILQQVHDSITIQIPLSSPCLGAAIIEIARIMNIEMEASGRKFTVPTDVKVGFDLKHMLEIPLTTTAQAQEDLVSGVIDGNTRGGRLGFKLS